jgi:hypothetical protein
MYLFWYILRDKEAMEHTYLLVESYFELRVSCWLVEGDDDVNHDEEVFFYFFDLYKGM